MCAFLCYSYTNRIITEQHTLTKLSHVAVRNTPSLFVSEVISSCWFWCGPYPPHFEEIIKSHQSL